MMRTALPSLLLLLIVAVGAISEHGRAEGDESAGGPPASDVRNLVRSYCLDCHGRDEPSAGLDLASITEAPLAEHSDVWERVVRKLRVRQMPPAEMPRPKEPTFVKVVNSLSRSLDAVANRQLRPGRTETFRRLTRNEYRNAIRDLLALDVDVASLLPADQASHGFDNITVGDLSPTLLNRYVAAAQEISRLAVGRGESSPGGKTFRIRPDVTQEERMDGLPFGTRGGALFAFTFPQDGEYAIQIRLTRDRNEQVEGLHEPHVLELLLDLEQVKSFTVRPPGSKAQSGGAWETPTHENVDRHLRARFPVTAGPHEIGVTFLKNPTELLESRRQPLHVHFNMYRHPRIGPAIYQVSINGPFEPTGPGDTPSRRRLFVCTPSGPDHEVDCARQILATLMRRAYRRPVDDADLERPLELFQDVRSQEGFEAGIEMALAAVLVNPEFLFRIEQDPADVSPGTAYRISDLLLASRLSFFLWSSLPDDELLELAERGVLSRPDVLEQQTRRMLADDRSRALVDNFAGQWLYLRNLESITPDARLFPDFDHNLREAFRRETELFFESVLREDRSVLDLLKADDTFLNERLAQHYGIPHVYGRRFRRVALDENSRRGGLLRQGSLLTVTSYATRTSPVIRGKWILENILGTPPPPPPDNIPALKDNTVAAHLSVRERLAQHRADPACASCHDQMDPIGFCLENFDAVGRWRDVEAGQPVDASGGLPDGSVFSGVSGLEQGLLDRPEIFVGTMTEKLLTYALGRELEPYDAPAVRAVVREAEAEDFRFSSLILGLVKSVPFQMRTSQ